MPFCGVAAPVRLAYGVARAKTPVRRALLRARVNIARARVAYRPAEQRVSFGAVGRRLYSDTNS